MDELEKELKEIIEDAYCQYLTKQAIKGYSEGTIKFNPSDVFNAIAQAVREHLEREGWVKMPSKSMAKRIGLQVGIARDIVKCTCGTGYPPRTYCLKHGRA